MLSSARVAFAVTWIGLVGAHLLAQPPAKAPMAPPPPPNAIAATVNGTPITEIAVYRAMIGVPQEKLAEARDEILKFLTENVLIDQYLDALKFIVDKKDVDARMNEIRTDFKKRGEDIAKWLKDNHLTENELLTQTMAVVRFDKFIEKYATDEVLRKMFDGERVMFDGSQMRVRHILLKAPAGNAQAVQQAQQRLLQIRKQVEDRVSHDMTKVPANLDKLAQEKERQKIYDKAFAEIATKESACPSKSQGGDVGYFPRAFKMVEPFAKAAFALKPYQMSDVVNTEFGHHLILAIDHKPGKDVKFEEVRELVKEVYVERVREAIVARGRPNAKIVINAAPK
jgi:parvulin-like peptidyl-prolyl isomerase